MLVAAAAGAGYGIGRSVDGESADLAAGQGTSEEPATAEAAEETEETVSTAAPATGAEDLGDSAGDGVVSSGGVGYPAFGMQPMETLYERVTDGGLVLRAQMGPQWEMYDQGMWGPGDWRPAPWCFESGQLRVTLTGDGVVDVGGAPWYAEAFEGRAVSSLMLGANDSNPQWVVVVQTPPGVTNVGVAFEDGSTDETTPQNGFAMLTVPGVLPEPTDSGIDSGDELYGGAIGTWDDPVFLESCAPPPPALPDAGDQPADPAAAEADINAAMAALYGAIGSDGEAGDFLDDASGVAEAREQVQGGGFAADAASATATIDELVFTAPDEAWFRYRVDTDGNDFSNRYGIAVFVDGSWKITRATVCQDLQLAGGDCGGGWEPISPPSAANRYDEYGGGTPGAVLD